MIRWYRLVGSLSGYLIEKKVRSVVMSGTGMTVPTYPCHMKDQEDSREPLRAWVAMVEESRSRVTEVTGKMGENGQSSLRDS